MKTFGMAAIAAGLLTAGSGAVAAPRETVAAPRETISIRLDTSGVDFADPMSVVAFHREVERQIRAVCNPGDRIGADNTPDFQCRQELAASLAPTLQQLAMRATGRTIAGT